MKWRSLSRVRLFSTPWTVAHQIPLSMGVTKQEYWNGLPFLPTICHQGYHYVPIRMVKIQNTDSTKCWWGFKATGALIHHWWECKIIQTFWKTVWCLLIKLNIHLLYDPINRVSWCLPKRVENLCSYKNLHVDIFSRFIINCQNLEATVFH